MSKHSNTIEVTPGAKVNVSLFRFGGTNPTRKWTGKVHHIDPDEKTVLIVGQTTIERARIPGELTPNGGIRIDTSYQFLTQDGYLTRNNGGLREIHLAHK